MKRKAILIESSKVAGATELPGAVVDIENWRNFLKSDWGGAWRDSEIISLSQPGSSDVEAALNVDSDCYCFVAFSGHGSNGAVLLNEYWSNGFAISKLKPRSSRGTLIVDACRGVQDAEDYFRKAQALENMSIANTVVYKALMGRSVIFASSADLSERVQLMKRAGIVVDYRQRWDEALDASSNGIVEMLACAKGQAAGENPSAGGYYTSLLLQSADLWRHKTTSAKIHTTKEAHDYAASQLPDQQTPEYSPWWLAFPFAVKV
jgi:hypothetical protein